MKRYEIIRVVDATSISDALKKDKRTRTRIVSIRELEDSKSTNKLGF